MGRVQCDDGRAHGDARSRKRRHLREHRDCGDGREYVVTLAWTPPTENVDGSTLVDLSGYKIHYGDSPQSYSETISVSNPGLTRYVIDALPPGTHYVAMTAYNASGAESDYSDEVQVTVN